MGVSGLLPLLKSIQRATELKKFQGKTLGVDGYGWLHRAAYSCATELAQGKPTNKWINAFMHRVRMLRHFGVTPYMVFDGDFLPSKAATEESRATKRDERKKLAMELLSAGKPSQATQEFQKCIDVTPEMASILIQHLKKLDIACVVAPYEADAQLVYLERHGFIDGIISDDSDLLVFGAKCLLTKLDQYGHCIEVNRRDFTACREVALTGWTDADFRRMAIMSGCDYLEGLPGVGLKTAYRILRNAKTPERAVRMVQFQGKRVSENYLTRFYQAELTFLHQWVFCPKKQELVHLTELDGTRTADEMPFIGAHVPPELAQSVARGDVDPITKLTISIPTTPSKRRHSQLANVASQPASKSINSYFKGGQRIPMGEMDRNCFTVDPQRTAEITNGGLVPRVFPLPRPYLDTARRSTTTAPRRTNSVPLRTSPRLRQRYSEPLSGMLSRVGGSPTASRSPQAKELSSIRSSAKTETPRLRKKARLCEEDDDDTSPKQSRFFPKTGSASTPPKKSTDDFQLRSDDSIEEALLSLPDMDDWKAVDRSKERITVFEERQHVQKETETNKSTSEKAEEAVPYVEDRDLMPPPTSTTISAPLMTTRSRSSLNRFSFSSSSTPSTVASKRSSIFSEPSTPFTPPSTVSSRLTPLQRLGAKAFQPSPMPEKTRPKRNSGLKGFLDGISVTPAFVPLPKVDLEEVEALSRPCNGSEDQIVSDSEGDDNNDDNGEEEPSLPPKKLNLRRFAFA